MPIIGICATLHTLFNDTVGFISGDPNLWTFRLWTICNGCYELCIKALVIYGNRTSSRKPILFGLVSPLCKMALFLPFCYYFYDHWLEVGDDDKRSNKKWNAIEGSPLNPTWVFMGLIYCYFVIDNTGMLSMTEGVKSPGSRSHRLTSDGKLYQSGDMPKADHEVFKICFGIVYYMWLIYVYKWAIPNNEKRTRQKKTMIKSIKKSRNAVQCDYQKDGLGSSGLFQICQSGNNHSFREYMKKYEYKVNINETDENNNTVLHVAVEKGSAEIVSLLLKKFNKQIKENNLRNTKGLTPLDVALQKDDLEVVRVLAKYPRLFRIDEKTIIGALWKDNCLDTIKLLYRHLKLPNAAFEQELSRFTKLAKDCNYEKLLDAKIALIETLKSGQPEDSSNAGDSGQLILDGLKCTNCEKLPVKGLQVFVCSKNHYVCSACLNKTDNCKACSENYKDHPPSRRHIAEKIIAKKHN